MNKEDIAGWLLLLGGTLAVSVSITLLLWLALRPGVEINPLNAITCGLGLMGGAIAIVFPGRLRLLAAANLILLLAAAPAMFGVVWLLYVPPLFFVAIGTTVKILNRHLSHRQLTGPYG